MRKLGFLMSAALIANIAASQNMPVLKFGDLDTSTIVVDEFITQRQLKTDKGYEIKKAIVYFSGANFSNIRSVNFYPDFDSVLFFKYRNILVAGSGVAFEAEIAKKATGQIFKSIVSFAFYGLKKTDLNYQKSPNIIELERLLKLKFISGTVYFSGVNFPNVVIVRAGEQKSDGLKPLTDRSGPGTIITFSGAMFVDGAGKKELVTKMVKLD